MNKYATHLVPVEGGDLLVAVWGDSGPVIAASHGITANHIGWLPVVEKLGKHFRFVAVDHRGRGKSRSITGPWGMQEHADDISAALEYLGISHVDLLLGHSMGGFVAAILAAQNPSMFSKIIMLDGGFPLMDSLPDGVTVEQIIQALLGPSIKRIDMRFASHEEYHQFWKKHPALLNDWSDYIRRYADYDLIEGVTPLRSGVKKQAIMGDVESQLTSDTIPNALEMLQTPIRFIRAEKGAMGDAPLYPVEVVEKWAQRYTDFSWTTFEGLNHFTVLMSETGAERLANEIRQQCCQ